MRNRIALIAVSAVAAVSLSITLIPTLGSAELPRTVQPVRPAAMTPAQIQFIAYTSAAEDYILQLRAFYAFLLSPEYQATLVAAQAAPAEAPGPIWACIIRHESGGDPTAVNPSSGAGGLYQFLPSTWQANGGSGLPEDAPASVQTAEAMRVQAQEGWSPWIGDGCTPLG